MQRLYLEKVDRQNQTTNTQTTSRGTQLMSSQNAQIQVIKAALLEMDIEPSNEVIRAIVTLIGQRDLSIEEAVLAYAEAQGQSQRQESSRIPYEGKNSEGFSGYVGRKSAEQVFAIANELSVYDAEEINKARELLTAKRIEQHGASDQFWGNVAGHLQVGLSAKRQATEQYLEAIEGHFVAKEVDNDFFTKALSGGHSTLLLGAAK
jgi:hypothetical protein